jgi:hypothetical protein
MQEETKSRLNSRNAYYHLVQNLLSSRLLSKNIKIRIHRTIILPVFCMSVELVSHTTVRTQTVDVGEYGAEAEFEPKRK